MRRRPSLNAVFIPIGAINVLRVQKRICGMCWLRKYPLRAEIVTKANDKHTMPLLWNAEIRDIEKPPLYIVP